jgi:hypothetical protein
MRDMSSEKGVMTATYHEVDGAASSQDVGTGDDRPATIQPFRGSGVVEGSGFRVQLHVTRVDTRAVDPAGDINRRIT